MVQLQRMDACLNTLSMELYQVNVRVGRIVRQLSSVLARVFSQKLSFTFVGNMGIYSEGTESVYQTVQTGKIECLAGVSREGLTREILARHSCLHLYKLFAFQSCARHMLHLAGSLVARHLREVF